MRTDTKFELPDVDDAPDAMWDSRRRKGVSRRADAIRRHKCSGLVAVLERPNSYKNLGAVLRNVDAFGAEMTYVIDPDCLFPEHWQSMRRKRIFSKTSSSAVKWNFVKRFESTQQCIEHLAEELFVSVVTSPHRKDTKNAVLHEVDYTAFKKLAVWFGNESQGISDLAVEHAALCVSIPMFGMVESLNLGTSSGIVLCEIARQRREHTSHWGAEGEGTALG